VPRAPGTLHLVVYLDSFVSDLRADSTELSFEVQFYGLVLEQLNDMSHRLSGAEVSRDTLEQIARYEFHPFFDPSNELNRSTLASLISTGDIKLYDQDLRDRLIIFNTRQTSAIKLMDENVDIFLGTLVALNYPPTDHPTRPSSYVSGPLLDKVWVAISTQELAETAIRAISGKSLMIDFVGGQKRQLLDSTIQFLEYLRAREE
jgi:hypothetical protein